ncbi:MAG: hypothetical protein GXX99_07810 [Clostridiales bacterium]|nr:hypothetical protein [Clostridiales bacterium]
MQKDRVHTRWQRSRAIRRKLGILHRIGGEALAEGWTRGHNGRLSKGKIHCSCRMCRIKSCDCPPHTDLKRKQDAGQQLKDYRESEARNDRSVWQLV